MAWCERHERTDDVEHVGVLGEDDDAVSRGLELLKQPVHHLIHKRRCTVLGLLSNMHLMKGGTGRWNLKKG